MYHQSSIVSMMILEKETKETSQIASLDDRGTINVWVIVDLPVGDSAGSEVDLGLGLNR